jgi:hypothetical protein
MNLSINPTGTVKDQKLQKLLLGFVYALAFAALVNIAIVSIQLEGLPKEPNLVSVTISQCRSTAEKNSNELAGAWCPRYLLGDLAKYELNFPADWTLRNDLLNKLDSDASCRVFAQAVGEAQSVGSVNGRLFMNFRGWRTCGFFASDSLCSYSTDVRCPDDIRISGQPLDSVTPARKLPVGIIVLTSNPRVS